jgi:membrane protein DedA with SNARE-associated domain
MRLVRYYARLLYMPLTAVVVFVTLFLVWELFDLPPADVVMQKIQVLFDLYGLPVLFLSSIIEGLLLVGGYFPGSFVIILGVLFADSALGAAGAVLVVMTGLYIAHCSNFFLGKYGLHRMLVRFGLTSSVESAKDRLSKSEFIALFSTYWMPSVAAIVDTAAGILQMPTRRFLAYSFFSVLFWGPLVGLVVYLLGDAALFFASPSGKELGVLVGILALWAAVLVAIDYSRNGVPA